MKSFLFILALMLCSLAMSSQVYPGFINPSLEGTPGKSSLIAQYQPTNWTNECWGNLCYSLIGNVPSGWSDVGPHDSLNLGGLILPALTLAASDSNTYAVSGYGVYQEGLSQSANLSSGTAYCFDIDLIVPWPGAGSGTCQLQVWGGGTNCNLKTLLWTSPVISDTTWKTHTVSFLTTATYKCLIFRAHSTVVNDCTYIAYDNIRPSCSALSYPFVMGVDRGENNTVDITLESPISSSGYRYNLYRNSDKISENDVYSKYITIRDYPIENLNTYRLSVIDINGGVVFSDSVLVVINSPTSVFPTLTDGEVNITSGNHIDYVDVYNSFGKLVIHIDGELSYDEKISLENLSDGVYHVMVSSNRTISNHKIIKFSTP